MSYIDLINRFWRLNSELPFSAFDTRFYFYLLSIANERGWQPNFMVPTRQLEFALGRSRKDIIAARQRLAARGLISFEKVRVVQRPHTQYLTTLKMLLLKLPVPVTEKH